jgi:prophage tail gpP-like protein
MSSEIKDWPTPGYQYELKKRDSARGLWGVAEKAYGDAKKWKDIWKANQDRARSSDPNRGFWLGDVIIIPGDAKLEDIRKGLREDALPTIDSKGENDLTLVIEGQEIPLMSGRVVLTMDTCAHGWSGTTVWTPDNPERYELFKPYQYREAAVYIAGQLLIRGYLYKVSPKIDSRGRVIDLAGWSFTADAVDSTIKPPLEESNVTLEERARSLLEPMGIEVIFFADEDPPFKRVTANEEDKIFDHLADLAKQRGMLFTSTAQGRALFTQTIAVDPSGSVVEDFPPYMEVSIDFDGRERFNAYRVTASSPKKNSKVEVSIDDKVPRSRFTVLSANDNEENDLQKTADWARSKALADAMTINFPVNSWFTPLGTLWEPNTIFTVISPTIFAPNGFDFLIRSVEFILGEDGATAVLGLVPPSVYTGGELIEPWD